MPIRLDRVPALFLRPARPRVWFWLGLLPILLLLGLGLKALFNPQPSTEKHFDLWSLYPGLALLLWCVLIFGRTLFHVLLQSAGDAWDEAREADLRRKMLSGRRSQQVLHVNRYAAPHAPLQNPAAQLNALPSGAKVVEAQPCDPKPALLQLLTQVLADLKPKIAQLPDETPLALLLETVSSLQEQCLRELWQQALRQSGICRPIKFVEGSGLAVVDRWLNQHIGDQALLLVVALHSVPDAHEGSAQAAVGLLFGNRPTQTSLSPIAYLHRPEQERNTSADSLLYAARQALDWVPLDARSIEHAWRAGIDVQRDAAMATVLEKLQLPPAQGLQNLDALPGGSGNASAWLAIAAAAQTIQRGAGPQFIFSGGSPVDTGLWSTVLTPVLPLSK